MDQAHQEIAALERQVGADARSPLFARLADRYLLADRPKDALRICDAGIANFPFYSTGHLLKGRALYALNMFNEARREFEIVRGWLPFNATVYQWLESVPESEEQSLTPVEAAPAPIQAPAVERAGHETASQPASDDFFSTITSAPAPQSASDGVAGQARSAAVENVFGLPSEAPAGVESFGAEQPLAPEPGVMDAFGGSAAGVVQEAPQGEAFSGFGETAPTAAGSAAEESFEFYVRHMRDELGPTDTMSLEDYLSSGPQAAPETTPFAEVETPPMTAESSSFGGFEETVSSPEPSPFGEVEATSAESPLSPAIPEDATTAPELSPFGGFEETPAVAAADAGSDAFAGPDTESFGEVQGSVPALESPASADATSGFSGPDLGGFPSVEEAATTPESSTAAEPEQGGFSGPAFEGPAPDNTIENITEKLQSAKKITPVIDFTQKAPSTAAEDTLASSGFVTPTLAEIYAKQGWFDDAIRAYTTLARTKPAEREKFEARIAELEELKKQQG